MPTNNEAGINRQSVYWTTETTTADGSAKTPADPTFYLWSDVVDSVEYEPSAEWEEQVSLGNSIAKDKDRSVESHEVTVNYKLARFPVDGSGNPQDPFAYGVQRDTDNRLKKTLTFLHVSERDSILKENSVHYKYLTEAGNTHPGTDPGASATATRTELYGVGGKPDEPSLSANPGDSARIAIEYGMQFEKVRKYQFDQPSADTWLHLRSSAAGDTGVSVSLETVDGAVSESVTLDGADATTAVATTSKFDSLRVHVDGAFDGVIEVYQDDGSGAGVVGAPGRLLATIVGKNSYDGIEYDEGVPILGAGSYESESGLKAISSLGTAGTFGGSAAAQRVMSSTLSVSNNLEDTVTANGLRRGIHEGVREASVEATIYGETEGFDSFADHMKGTEGELVIPTTEGDIKMPRAYVREGGSTEMEAGNAVLQVEVVFGILEPSDGSDPVQFTTA